MGISHVELEAGDEVLLNHLLHLLGDLVVTQSRQVRERLELGHDDVIPHLHEPHSDLILHRAQAGNRGRRDRRGM